VIRSEANIPGYWKLPEVTATVIDAEGWLRTGERRIPGRGRVPLHTGPDKGMIISGAREHLSRRSREINLLVTRTWPRSPLSVCRTRPGGRRSKRWWFPKLGTHPDPADIIAFARTRHRQLQGSQECGVHRRLAAQRFGKDPAPNLARALLGRPRRGVNERASSSAP